MDDQIRQSRLNRFKQFESAQSGNSTPKSAPAEPESNVNSASSQSTPASGASPVPAAAPVQGTTPAASSDSANPVPFELSAHNVPSKLPEHRAEATHSPVAPVKDSPQPSSKPRLSSDEWFNNVVTNVFKVSLTPREGFITLSSLAEDKDLGPLFAPDELDQIMWEALTSPQVTSNNTVDIFEYLFDCWERSLQPARHTRGQPDRKELISQVQDALVRYAVVCATASAEEDLHGNLGRILIERVSGLVPWDFVESIIKNAQAQDLLPDLLGLIFDTFVTVLRKGGPSRDCINIFSVTDSLLDFELVARGITELDGFAVPEDATPEQIATSTILGPYFSISPLDNGYPLKLFPGIENMTSMQIYQVVQNTQAESKLILDRLFGICYKIVKPSGHNRERLLDFFVQVLNRNHRRTAMQVDKKKVNADGFMANISYVVVKFCEPFMDLNVGKIEKVDPLYFKTAAAYDIEEETRIVSSVPEAKEWREEGGLTQEVPNFITQIFFIAVGYLQFGVHALTMAENRLKRQEEAVQAQYDRFRQMATGNARFDFISRRVTQQLAMVKSDSAALAIILRHEEVMTMFYEFATFAFVFSVRQAEPKRTYPKSQLDILSVIHAEPDGFYKTFPEYLIEAPLQAFIYIGRTLPQVPRSKVHQEIVEGIILFMRAPQFIKNPYLRSKMVEVLLYGGMDQPLVGGGKLPGYYLEIFNTNKLSLDYLFHALMKLYVDMEQTGRSTQFYDKFNTREVISLVMKILWQNPIYRENLEKESHVDTDFFVRFVALLLNDSTYLLDEALSKLQDIHRLQTDPQENQTPSQENPEGANNGEEEEEDANTPQRRLASAERDAKLYLQLSSGTVDLLGTFTASIPKPFVSPEIVDRFATMMNYNLVALVGPKCRELVVKNPEKYGFNPKALLSNLVKVYLNLATYEEFVRAVARDGRSYSVQNFERADAILSKRSLLSHEQLTAWRTLKERTEEVKVTDELEDEEMADVPDEFLDPLMFTIMEEPVILPTSKVTIDLSTIKAHLLSDPIDPFNRAPLKIEDVIPNAELKKQIEDYKSAKKASRS